MKSNPFYALSAAAMLGGCWLLSHALAFEAGRLGGLLVLVSALQVYEWLLVVLGVVLVARGLAPRDGTMALAIATLFLVDLTLVATECATADARLGPAIALALLVLAGARLAVAHRVAPGVLSRTGGLLLGLHAALVLALPVAAVRIADARQMGPGAIYGLSWVGLALPLLQLQLVAATRTSGAGAPRVHVLWSWLPGASVALHLAATAWIHDAALTPACLAPLLLGFALAAPRERLARQLVLPLAGIGLSLGQPALGFWGTAGDPLVSPLRLALVVAAASWTWLAWRQRELWPALLGVGAGLSAGVGPTLASVPDRLWQLARPLGAWAPRGPLGWGATSVTTAFVLLAVALWRSLNPPSGRSGSSLHLPGWRLGARELGAISLVLCGSAHSTVASAFDSNRTAPSSPGVVALLTLLAFAIGVFALRRATHGVLDPFARRLAGVAILASALTLFALPVLATLSPYRPADRAIGNQGRQARRAWPVDAASAASLCCRAGVSGRESTTREVGMSENGGRREFLKVAGVAGTAVAAAPSLVLGAQPQAVMAFVGCAHIHTPGFVKLLASRPDVRVKWAWDHDPARVAVRAPELEAQVGSLDQIFGDPEVKAVVICSETNRHPELVAAAAKARKHMFVEKPLGITAADSRAMAEAIEKAGVLFTTGYFNRTHPSHLFLKEQVANGAFGTITRASAWNCHSGSLGGWFDEKPGQPAESWRWMADPKIAGVGAFGDLGTHLLDILMWILGDVASVNAELKTVTRRYGDVDETGTSLIRFKSGASGTLTAGWVDVENPVTLQIAGTEGHAVIFNEKLYFESKKLAGSKIGEPWTQLPAGPKAPLHQFVDAVLGAAGQPLVTPREAAERVAVMEAMYASARSGQWTPVA